MRHRALFFLSLFLCFTLTARTDEFKLLSKPDSDGPQFLTEVCVGIGVAAVGATAIIILLHYCDKWFGTNQPPPGTNTFNIYKSDNLAAWNNVGSVTCEWSNFSWSETNSIVDKQHYYRLSYE